MLVEPWATPSATDRHPSIPLSVCRSRQTTRPYPPGARRFSQVKSFARQMMPVARKFVLVKWYSESATVVLSWSLSRSCDRVVSGACRAASLPNLRQADEDAEVSLDRPRCQSDALARELLHDLLDGSTGLTGSSYGVKDGHSVVVAGLALRLRHLVRGASVDEFFSLAAAAADLEETPAGLAVLTLDEGRQPIAFGLLQHDDVLGRLPFLA